MLASDKTNLTRHYGDKYMHAVYMSCGNIDKDIRTKESANCWMLVAQIPVVQFEEKEDQTTLANRLLHLCLDIVTEKLKACSETPVNMCDGAGILRKVRAILLAHLADHPEQLAIACVQKNSSPLSMARYHDLDAGVCKPIRTGQKTLSQIESVLKSGVSSDDITGYEAAVTRMGLDLNGVTAPYWRDWKFACPSTFLATDALHQWHKFFGDHILKWTRKIVKDDKELDCRYMALQKHVGRRHFPQGFTSYSQHTCRENRNIESKFIAALSGLRKISPGIMRAFRALVKFYYLGQYDTHSTKTLHRLRLALR